MKQNVAVVGCGNWGRNIVRNFYELGALNTVYDMAPEALELLKKEYPSINTTPNIDEVLSSSDIKAVAIASSAVSHYELVKKALLSDKDVFVEKTTGIEYQRGGRVGRAGCRKG